MVKISPFENDRSKIKVSTQPVAGHTLPLTLASVEVSHSDSNENKTWGLQMKIKYLSNNFLASRKATRSKEDSQGIRVYRSLHVYSRCRYLMTLLIEEWRLFDRQIIDRAIKQWRSHLRSCVREQGGHFEHQLCLNFIGYSCVTVCTRVL